MSDNTKQPEPELSDSSIEVILPAQNFKRTAALQAVTAQPQLDIANMSTGSALEVSKAGDETLTNTNPKFITIKSDGQESSEIVI